MTSRRPGVTPTGASDETSPRIVIETADADDPETMDRVVRVLIDILNEELEAAARKESGRRGRGGSR